MEHHSVVITEAASTELSKEGKRRAREILSNTPVIALYNSMRAKADTEEQLLDNLESVVACLRDYMNRETEASEDLAELKHIVKSGQKLFAMMTGMDVKLYHERRREQAEAERLRGEGE